jgi:hypothetical protein
VEQGGPTSSNPILPPIRLESVVVALVAVVFVVFLFVGAGPPERPQPAAARPAAKPQEAAVQGPKAVTPKELQVISASLPFPVYSLGERPGTKLELTATADRIYIRYLPKNGKIGNPSLAYPFVATYQYPNALAVVRRASRRKGAVTRRLPRGGLAVQSKNELVQAVAGGLPAPPVFLAYPGSDRLVELYDRSARRALALVASGRVRRVR